MQKTYWLIMLIRILCTIWNVVAVVSLMSYGYLVSYLNDEEKKLYSASKAKSLLCIANGKLALEIAKRRYVSGLYNGAV